MIEFWYFPLEASLYHQPHTEIAIISGGAIDIFMLFIYNLSIKVQLRLSLDTHTQKHLSTHLREYENLFLHVMVFTGSVAFFSVKRKNEQKLHFLGKILNFGK